MNNAANGNYSGGVNTAAAAALTSGGGEESSRSSMAPSSSWPSMKVAKLNYIPPAKVI